MSTYTEAVERNLHGLGAVSTGHCPGCEECADDCGLSIADFDAAYDAGTICEEAHFSWSSCGICGSPLGGDREVWHAIMDGRIVHFDDACVDCVAFLSNGDEPEGRDETQEET